MRARQCVVVVVALLLPACSSTESASPPAPDAGQDATVPEGGDGGGDAGSVPWVTLTRLAITN